MISLLCIFIASFFNAIMDACENAPNFNESIFKDKPRRFWLKTVSWEYAKKIFGYKLDAWHLSKTFMIIFICAAIYLEQFSNQIWHTKNTFLNIGIDVIIAGVIWNLSFTLFYHHIFKVK